MDDVLMLELLSVGAARSQASEIRELLKIVDNPDIISFAGGIPSPEAFPTKAVRAAMTLALDQGEIARSLQYGISEGHEPLRHWIANRISGSVASVDTILITSGAQQALDIIARLLIDASCTVILTRPTYLGAIQVFNYYTTKFLYVACDKDGPIVDELENAFKAGGKLFYLVTSFDNPSGQLVSDQRRDQILDIARAYDAVIVEDGAYEDIYFEDAPPPSLYRRSVEAGSSVRVFHCGTFSKTVAPGFRVGWLAGPSDFLSRAVFLKQAVDLHSSTVGQRVIHEVVAGDYDEHLRKIRQFYAVRRDSMVQALHRFMPNDVIYNRPTGGLFVWVRLPDDMDASLLLQRALKDYGVAFVPGAAFHGDHTNPNTLRLSYSTVSPDQIERGVENLARAISDVRQ